MIRGIYNPHTGKVEEVNENKTKTAFNNFKNVISKGISIMLVDFDVDDREAALAMSDLISLVLKAPMLLPPLRYVEKVPENANNFETLANYVLQRHVEGKVSPDKVTEVVKGDWGGKGNSNNKNRFLRYISLFQDEIYSVYEALMTVPADTRPGNNIGSLAAHLSISSMAEWAIFHDSKDLPYLRLATVLHDIGKLTDFGRHWESSKDFFEGLVEEIQKNSDINTKLRSELVDVLRNAEGRAEEHHLFNIEGDLISSGEGRIERSDLDQLYSSIQDCSPFRETLYMRASEAEDFINEQEKKDKSLKAKYEGCSKQIYKKLQERQRSNKEDDDINPSQNVVADLNMINFPGVQSFIKFFSDLRDISAASTLVDMSVTTIPFVVIDNMYEKTYLPLDSLLISSGGHSFIVTRRDSSNVNEKRIEEELGKVTLLQDLDVSLTVSSTPLILGNGPYRMRGYKTVKELFSKDGVKGLKISPSSFKIVSPGLHAICESCGMYPAVKRDERGKRLCRRCYTVHEISKSKGFSSKVNASFKIGSIHITPLKEALEAPMSYLSGDTIDEGKSYEPVKAPRGYLSVVKSDGNDAGEYFSSSLNFDEYIDKSFKVDYWVKKSFVEAADEAEENGTLNKGMIMRTLLGVQYMGGDDILLIGPAMTAPLLAMNALEKASSKLGMSFKVGVATVKNDSPIQFAIDAADKLMEDGKIRREEIAGSTTNNDEVKREQERNTLTFLFASSLVTRSSVEEIKKEWSAGPLSPTRNPKEQENERAMYKMKTNFSFWKDVINLSEDLKLVLKSVPTDYEKNVDSFKDYVRVMEDIVETFHKTKDPYYTVIYMMRQATRHKEVSRLMLTLLKGWDKSGQIPLIDAFYMFKTALVEAGDRGESS